MCQSLECHSHNISCVAFLPGRSLVASSSEYGTVRLWHSNIDHMEQTLSYGFDRSWSISYLKSFKKLLLVSMKELFS